MWSTLGRNFISDSGFEYFPAKWATSELYDAEEFHNSVMLGLAELANSGVTTVNNWSHNNRSSQHVDAELDSAHASRCCGRDTPSVISTVCRSDVVNKFDDLDRVQAEWFPANPRGSMA